MNRFAILGLSACLIATSLPSIAAPTPDRCVRSTSAIAVCNDDFSAIKIRAADGTFGWADPAKTEAFAGLAT